MQIYVFIVSGSATVLAPLLAVLILFGLVILSVMSKHSKYIDTFFCVCKMLCLTTLTLALFLCVFVCVCLCVCVCVCVCVCACVCASLLLSFFVHVCM